MFRVVAYCIALAVVAVVPAMASERSSESEATGPLVHVAPATSESIAVYGTSSTTKAQFDRARDAVVRCLRAMDPRIRVALIASEAKMIVARDEEELEADLDFYVELFPLEAVFTDIDGVDETLPGDRGVSGSELELMYLVVYYALLTEPGLAAVFAELVAAYDEAEQRDLFVPGEAYQDDFVDEIHLHASENNALKYGSYLFGLYAVYFGNGQAQPGEFLVTRREDLEKINPKGARFMRIYLDARRSP